MVNIVITPDDLPIVAVNNFIIKPLINEILRNRHTGGVVGVAKHTYPTPPKQTKDEAIKYVSLHDLW